MNKYQLIILPAVFSLLLTIHSYSQVWISDQGNGTYKSPVLHADYSDPDVCRAGNDFYMTASSFNCVPGLPVLHSKDLMNWTLINYALPKLSYAEGFDKPQHGKGVWAPCIRYHKGEFYIYFPDPDHGIYMIKTNDPAGVWSEPVLVKGGKGLIDPSPLWDDDGKVYLTYAFAGSRAGIKSLLMVCSMNEEGTRTLDDDVIVFDGHDEHPTIEGPKFHKRNGYYYIFAPAGGVSTGWQLVLRSKNVFGPYEHRVVMDQGTTKINGPHQGAWVELDNGENWFFHFQDKGAYGRIVHLQPMVWKNDWPVIGEDKKNTGKGEPVSVHKKPNVGKTYPKSSPPESDEFNDNTVGLQWQWHANPQPYWAYPMPLRGQLRLFAYPLPEGFKNFWDAPNLLLQKLPAPAFQATTKITFTPRFEGEKTGLIVMGRDYAYVSVRNKDGKLRISQVVCANADKAGEEAEYGEMVLKTSTFYLRIKVVGDALCEFSYSEDGKNFKNIGQPFKAREGMWIGAKVGLFCTSEKKTNDAGNADVDWFRVEKIN
ncbi:MAG: glycoside hydrolase 43 family protein [Cyclobacteriaceae bacterium]|nr:glycoside hydrolase 43 family protein [Cyclobacteriaceae bacterium]